MYITEILSLHIGKNVIVYMKSGTSFRGFLSKIDEPFYIGYLSREMSGQWLTSFDTRCVESIQIEETDLSSQFKHLILNK